MCLLCHDGLHPLKLCSKTNLPPLRFLFIRYFIQQRVTKTISTVNGQYQWLVLMIILLHFFVSVTCDQLHTTATCTIPVPHWFSPLWYPLFLCKPALAFNSGFQLRNRSQVRNSAFNGREGLTKIFTSYTFPFYSFLVLLFLLYFLKNLTDTSNEHCLRISEKSIAIKVLLLKYFFAMADYQNFFSPFFFWITNELAEWNWF